MQPTPEERNLGFDYRIIRSIKRKKTISATFQNGVLVVRVPRGMSRREELDWVQKMRERLELRSQRRMADNPALKARAQLLNTRHFGGELVYSIAWSEQQHRRWGSCTPLTGEIRISRELADFPLFVLDYVIMHELAHLQVPDHSAEFWSVVNRYPRTERARGFLQGFARGVGDSSEDDDEED